MTCAPVRGGLGIRLMPPASPLFDAYRREYPARAPDLNRRRFENDCLDVRREPSVNELECAPVRVVAVGAPPDRANDDGTNKMLWVVATDGVPWAQELDSPWRALGRESLSHTNLTGGGDAHSGGELWFRDTQSVYLNGGSGRYEPRSPEEMTAVEDAFRAAGLLVASCGWNIETAKPRRYFREPPVWR